MKKSGTILVILFILLAIEYGFVKDNIGNKKKLSNEQNVSSNIEWLIFSSTKFTSERNLVKKQEHISNAKAKHGRIYIALADLNNDGAREIFAYIDISYYCGQQIGCPLNIYEVKHGELISLLRPEFIDGFPMFIEIDKTGKQYSIGILPTKTEGRQDIILIGGTIWKWNGNYYGKN